MSAGAEWLSKVHLGEHDHSGTLVRYGSLSSSLQSILIFRHHHGHGAYKTIT